MKRIFNFSAGPSILPVEALQQAQTDLVDYQGTGMSIMEMSHRGKVYEAVHQEAIDNLRKILGVPDDYAILFLQGGGHEQFAWVPLNFLTEGKTADYMLAGAWGLKAYKEAQTIGKANAAADVTKIKPARMPSQGELKPTPGAAYLHITSNETIEGIQLKSFPKTDAPLVADMSSDILSRPIDVKSFGLIYAGAQKNVGPAGVTIVIVRKDWVEKGNPKIPNMFRYSTHLKENSLYNTPPCFAIYMVMLVTRLLLKKGGLAAIAETNRKKAQKLYETIDGSSGYYRGTADPAHRSDMNVTFRLPSEELEERFIKQAKEYSLDGLKGHRSVGGIRASIYNAFPAEGVDALVGYMKEFQKKNG
ncbi:MAG TPA: 3-phosphoserine/phosphohydroxythreonine transaminase [Elusimicrobiota bacterium]|nr:3-phosphoserine/phosphohydroxythreonine transaminase [Elusimicrobiota bacterium]